MQELLDVVMESWDRQAQIVANVAEMITPEVMNATSGKGEWTIGDHLTHIHGVRLFWLGKMSPGSTDGMDMLDRDVTGDDLPVIRKCLVESAKKVRDTTRALIVKGGPVGQYEHPVFFLQHMVWHEGWHVGSIMRSLRAVGREPSDEWSEKNMWELWRGVEEWE